MDSRIINYLRFPLAIAIIFIHCKHIQINWESVYYNPLTSNNILALIHFYTAQIIAPVAIQIFFMFSGYLFFANIKEFSSSIYFNKLKKRIFSTLIPYILWIVIFIILFLITFKLFPALVKDYNSVKDFLTANERGWWHLFWDSKIAATRNDMLGYPYDITFPAHSPLWFIRDLIVAFILSPITYFIAKYCKITGFILFFLIVLLGIGNYIHGISMGSLFYFFFGAYISINTKGLVNTFYMYKKIAGTALPFLLIGIFFVNYIDRNEYYYLYLFAKSIQSLFSICLIVYLIPTLSGIIERKNITTNLWLANTSFFIYVFHSLFALQLTELVLQKILHSQNFFIQLFNYVFSVVICAGISLLTYYLLEKFTPKLLSILIGNRNIKVQR